MKSSLYQPGAKVILPERRAHFRWQRWILNLAFVNFHEESFCGDFLGGKPWFEKYSGLAQNQLSDRKISCRKTCLTVLERMRTRSCQDFLPTGARYGSLKAHSYSLIEKQGIEAIARSLPAAMALDMLWIVQHSVTARWLEPREAWNWARKAGTWLQDIYSDWVDFQHAYLVAREYFEGSDKNIPHCRKLFVRHNQEGGNYSELPFDEDLFVSVPYIPNQHATLRFSVHMVCPRCGFNLPLSELIEVNCPGCKTHLPFSESNTNTLFWDACLNFLKGNSLNQWSLVYGFPDLSIWKECGDPVCAWCSCKLGISSQEIGAAFAKAKNESTSQTEICIKNWPQELRCPHCDGKHTLSLPNASLWKLFPAISAIIYPQGSPQKLAPFFQIVIPQRLNDSMQNASAPLRNEDTYYLTDAHQVPEEIKPLPQASNNPKLSPYKRWILALGAIESFDLKGDPFFTSLFPKVRYWQSLYYKWLIHRYPDMDRARIQGIFHSQNPTPFENNLAAKIRYLLDIGRFALVAGWLDEDSFWNRLEKTARQLSEKIFTWEQFSYTLLSQVQTGVSPSRQKQIQNKFVDRFWKHIPWGGLTALIPDWESIHVQGNYSCPRCSTNIYVSDYGKQQFHCSECGSKPVLSKTIYQHLSPHLFAFRRSKNQYSQLIIDYTDDGMMQWQFDRNTLKCIRCEIAIPSNFHEHPEIKCPRCGLRHELESSKEMDFYIMKSPQIKPENSRFLNKGLWILWDYHAPQTLPRKDCKEYIRINSDAILRSSR